MQIKKYMAAGLAAWMLFSFSANGFADSLEEQRDAYVKKANEKLDKSNEIQTKIQNFSD